VAALERIPLKRLGTPADMAGAAQFLASPLASYIIGQAIVVDGGLDPVARAPWVAIFRAGGTEGVSPVSSQKQE
jgi:hypothetical protein